MHELKKHLFLFTPEAYPHLLKWTTFPMNAAQELLYKQLAEKTKARGETLPKAVWHYWTEVLSMMERSTAVGYTGSMKIVPRQLGSTMWFGYAVHAGLLPCFNRRIVEFPSSAGEDTGNDWLKVHASKWPMERSGQRPLTSSGRMQELEYGEGFLQVSTEFIDACIICFNLFTKESDHVTDNPNRVIS